MRLIDADELSKRYDAECCGECDCCVYFDKNLFAPLSCGLIEEAPTIDVLGKLRAEVGILSREAKAYDKIDFNKGIDFAYDTILILIDKYIKGEQ